MTRAGVTASAGVAIFPVWSYLYAIVLVLSVLLAAPPGFAQGVSDKPVRVEVQIIMLDLDSIDSSQERFTANIALRARWHDPDLVGTVSAPTVMPLGEVWHPTFMLINQQKLFRTLEPSVRVYPDGMVEQRQRVWGDFSQEFDLRDFPLDSQKLEIRIVAVDASPDVIQFAESDDLPSGIAEALTISDWDVGDFDLVVEPYQPFSEADAIASIVFSVDVKRFTGYYLYKILVPLMLIIGMSYLVFWVALDAASTRYSIAVTSMLTLIAYRFMVGGLLPKVSYMTRLDGFVMLSTVMVFMVLLAVVITGAWADHHPARARALNWFARLSFPLLILGLAWYSFRL